MSKARRVSDQSQTARLAERLSEERRFLVLMLDNTPEAIAYLDNDLVYRHCNAAAAEQLGRSIDQIIGHRLDEILGPDSRMYEAVVSVLRTGKPFASELKTTWPDRPELGELEYIVSYIPDIDASGKVRGVFSSGRDITERKKAETALRASEARLAAMLRNAPIGMAVLNPAGAITQANRALAKMLGYGHSGLLNKPFVAFVHSDDAEEYADCYRALIDGRSGTCRIEARLVGRHERVVSVNLAISLVRGVWGAPSYALVIVEDIGERKQIERQREELLDRERHIADALQKALVPETLYEPECCSIGVRYEAAYREADIGGDFYDVFDMGDGRFGVLIGDVAGKGLRAAIRVSAVRHAVRSYAYVDSSPGRVMTRANDALCRDGDGDVSLVTAFFAVVDSRVGTIFYANAGHETPLVRTADGSIIEFDIPGRALGVMGGFDYPEQTRRLAEGDTIVMVTDGITEARPDALDLFGLEGIKRYLGKDARGVEPCNDLAYGVVEAAKAHAGGALKDDAAVVVVRWNIDNRSMS